MMSVSKLSLGEYGLWTHFGARWPVFVGTEAECQTEARRMDARQRQGRNPYCGRLVCKVGAPHQHGSRAKEGT